MSPACGSSFCLNDFEARTLQHKQTNTSKRCLWLLAADALHQDRLGRSLREWQQACNPDTGGQLVGQLVGHLFLTRWCARRRGRSQTSLRVPVYTMNKRALKWLTCSPFITTSSNPPRPACAPTRTPPPPPPPPLETSYLPTAGAPFRESPHDDRAR